MFIKRFSAILVGLSSFSLNSKALADINQGYIPPPNPDRIQRTEAGGSRGCDGLDTSVSLTLLTPHNHVATTVSDRPTFLWHVSALVPIRFALVEPGVSKPVMEKLIKAKKPGIVELKVPPSVPKLVVGKEYRWTVSIPCNEQRPSENIYARAWIKRVASTPELAQKLRGVSQERQRAEIYASSGIWNNAISAIYTASNADPKDQLSSKYFLELLNQVGLSKVATQEP